MEQVTDTTTWKIAKPKRPYVVTGVQYLNVTGLAEHSSNSFGGALKVGANVVSTLFDTDSDGAGSNSLAANTWIDGTLVTTAGYLNGAADDELTFVATENGTATLPAGLVRVEGYYTQPKL